MAQTRKGGSIVLPWERSSGWLRQLVGGRRWKAALFILIGALIAVGIGYSARHRARVRDTRGTIGEVKRAIGAFRADMGRCPSSIYELIHPPRADRSYLREVPVDGWGRALWVRCPGRYDPDGSDVMSAGPSGSFLVDDNLQ